MHIGTTPLTLPRGAQFIRRGTGRDDALAAYTADIKRAPFVVLPTLLPPLLPHLHPGRLRGYPFACAATGRVPAVATTASSMG